MGWWWWCGNYQQVAGRGTRLSIACSATLARTGVDAQDASFETLLYYLRGTTTSTGLTGRANLLEGAYARGQKVSVTEMEHLNIEHTEVCAQWNYILRPRVAALS